MWFVGSVKVSLGYLWKLLAKGSSFSLRIIILGELSRAIPWKEYKNWYRRKGKFREKEIMRWRKYWAPGCSSAWKQHAPELFSYMRRLVLFFFFFDYTILSCIFVIWNNENSNTSSKSISSSVVLGIYRSFTPETLHLISADTGVRKQLFL